jgi:hypothetical protein
MEPAAGLVKLAARRPAREFPLAGHWRSLVPKRHYHRAPCYSLPRPTWRRGCWLIPGLHDSERGSIKQHLCGWRLTAPPAAADIRLFSQSLSAFESSDRFLPCRFG